MRRQTLVLCLPLLVAFVAIACSSDDDAPPDVIVPPTSPAASGTPASTPAPTRVQAGSGDVDQRDIDAAEAYLAALADEDYGALWEMLADQTQALWGSPDTLTAFLSAKFGGRDLAFSVTGASALENWRDHEARPFYTTASSVSYSLTVDGEAAPQFGMAPVVVVRGDGGPRIAGLGPAARRAPVVTPLPPATTAIEMPIVVYHHVSEELPADPDQASITVTIDEFADQLDALSKNGYTSITTAELVNHFYYGLPLPDKPVILTFDDGYEDALRATTELDAYGFKGTFGIVSGFIGSPGYLTWDHVREMRDAGMEIVSHSASHPGLGGLTPEQLADEIAGSRAAIESEAGVPVQALIYPYGEPFATGTVEEQERVKASLHASGYAIAITNPLPGAYPDIYQDGATPYELKRLMVSPGMSLERFTVRLTGAELQ